MTPIRLSSDRIDETVSAFCDAFYDSAVTRYVIGDVGQEHDDRVRALIGGDSAYKSPLCQRRNRWGRLKPGR